MTITITFPESFTFRIALVRFLSTFGWVKLNGPMQNFTHITVEHYDL